MTSSSLKKTWALLDTQERRNAVKVLAVMIVGAFASAVMVGSVFSFLSVFGSPGLVASNDVLASAYEIGGFTSDYGFIVALGLSAVSVIIVNLQGDAPLTPHWFIKDLVAALAGDRDAHGQLVRSICVSMTGSTSRWQSTVQRKAST